jgi:hypothetical protein
VHIAADDLAGMVRVRQKRVVLTPVAGVKLMEARRTQPGSISREFVSDGGKNEFVAGESAP